MIRLDGIPVTLLSFDEMSGQAAILLDGTADTPQRPRLVPVGMLRADGGAVEVAMEVGR